MSEFTGADRALLIRVGRELKALALDVRASFSGKDLPAAEWRPLKDRADRLDGDRAQLEGLRRRLEAQQIPPSPNN